MKRRVVITGLGTVNPLGNSVSVFWDAIRAGKSGIGPITRFDAAEYPSRIAGELKDFSPGDFMDRKDARKMDLFSQYAVASAVQAWTDSGLKEGSVDPERTGVILGNGIGGIDTLESSYWALFEKGPSRIPPMTIPKLISNEGPGNVAIALNAQGPCYSVLTACAAGTDAMTNAVRWIRDGHLDVVVSGGTEAAITKLGVGGFCVLQALSTRNDEPERASRPFDKDRDGFVIAEGAGISDRGARARAGARGPDLCRDRRLRR